MLFFTAVGIATCLVICITLAVLAVMLVIRWTHIDGRFVGLWLPAIPAVLAVVGTYQFFQHVPLQIVGG
jgi:hypothetical protein